MKSIFIIVATLLLISCESEPTEVLEISGCDNGTFVGIVDLHTQQEVNAFGSLCYTKIDGRLRIGIDQDNDITDLTPLNNLTEVFSSGSTSSIGKIYITFADNLTSLQGLENIASAAGIVILDCNNLTNLQGLEGLTELSSLGGFNDLILTDNDNLRSLEGLNNLEAIGFLNSGIPTFILIAGNHSLENVDALTNLNSVYGSIRIGDYENQTSPPPQGNNNLTDFCGLQNLFTNGYFEEVDINFNAFNPSVEEIIAGDCSF